MKAKLIAYVKSKIRASDGDVEWIESYEEINDTMLIEDVEFLLHGESNNEIQDVLEKFKDTIKWMTIKQHI